MAGTSPPIHAWLEQIYRRYHRPRYVGHDPLARVLVHDDPGDQEVSGLVAALLAYGNVKAILGGIDDVMARLGSRPAGALAESRPARLRRRFQDFRYRVTSAEQMTALLLGVRTIRRRCGSLEAAFAAQVRPDDPTLVPAIGRWVDLITAAAGRPLPHLLPHPARGSACKRVMLYLRWMIRRDAIDPGPWAALPRQKLVVPLDTHLHRMAGRLGLTARRSSDLKAALEITGALARAAPADPLRYDFALTRPGILRDESVWDTLPAVNAPA